MSGHPPWLAIAAALALAKLLGEACQRLRVPPVLGELCAGMALGNLRHLPQLVPALARVGLDDVAGSPALTLLGELGAVVLLFQVGLESDARALLRAGRASARVAVVGVALPFALGFFAVGWLTPAAPIAVRAFVGAVLCATSVGITARVLRDLGRIGSPEARVILGAAVIDDVLGLIVLAVVLGVSRGGVAPWPIARLALIAAGFLGGAILLGRLLAPRLLRWTAHGRVSGRSLAVALTLCFVGAEGAIAAGLAAIVGAFAAGLVLDPAYEDMLVAGGEERIRPQVEALGAFLVPLFFVHMGAASDLAALDGRALALAGALAAAAVVGKLLTAAVAGGGVDRWAIGIGMVPRGEVGLIVAYQGTLARVDGRPLVDAATFAAVVLVVLATTVATPPVLAWRLRRAATSASSSSSPA